MPDCNKSRTLYSTCVTSLSFACFALAATAAVLPLWAYFVNPSVPTTPMMDKGHFGPWQICKESYYGTTKCGDTVSRFKPIPAVKIAGYFSAMCVILLAFFCLLNVLHLAMVVSREKVLLTYQTATISKFILSLLATLTSIIAAGLFSLQTDDKANSYQVTRGESFYIQIVVIVLNFLLFVSTLYDVIFARKTLGDPTVIRDPTGIEATTINNPGYREGNMTTGKTINVALTTASGNPYGMVSGTNDSTLSVVTNLSSNGSTVPSTVARSPLKPSLKKPKAPSESGLGIPNPGFSGSSPTFNRNGSMKKVRIQTQSTAV